MRRPHHKKIRRRSGKCLFSLAMAGFILSRVATAQADGVQLRLDRSENRFAGFPFNTALADASDSMFGFRDFAAGNELKQSNASLAVAPNDIRLRGHQNTVLTGAPGSTVSVNLSNFVLRGHSTLTLLGSSTTMFVLNITRHFSLMQSAKIVLAGNLQWNQIMFNVLGAGTAVSLSGKSNLSGILTANQRTVLLSGHALVSGLISAQRTVIRQAAQIVTPPIVSP